MSYRKTQLAVKFVKDQGKQDPSLWVLWIHARNAVRFEESVGDVVNQLRLPGRQTPKANLLQLLHYWLTNTRGGTKKWIVVLDNVDDASFLLEPPSNAESPQATKPRKDYFPSADGCRLLITSRTKREAGKLVNGMNMVEVPKMDADDADKLLRKGLEDLYDETTGRRLAEALEFMPLALAQAMSYLRERASRHSVAKYIEALQKGRDSRIGLLREEGSIPQSDRDASTSILLTWQISFTHIRDTRPSAAKLLTLMSFCDHQSIPERLLNVHDTSQGSRDDFEKDILALQAFMFISYAHPDPPRSWQMHRLVQDSMHWWLKNRDLYKSAEMIYLLRITQVFPQKAVYENWEACQVLLPHVENVFNLTISDFRGVQLGQATLCYRTAWYHWLQGNTNVALERAKVAVELRCKHLGEEHTDTLNGRTMLAFAFSAAGRWTEAEKILSQVAETSTRVKGAEDPSTLSRRADLALAYRVRGHHKQAVEELEQVMEAQKRLEGPEHLSTLLTTSDLATAYRSLGRWDEAEELDVYLVEISKKTLGPDHLDTLLRMQDLAATYWHQGKYVAAEELQERVVKILGEHKLGVNHPLRLWMMSNLATMYSDRGRLGEAIKINKQVIDSFVEKLGSDHPDTLLSMVNLAASYDSLGKWEAAVELQVQVLDTWQKKQLGRNHDLVLTCKTNLAYSYQNLKRWEDAEELGVEVLEIRKELYGDEHPDTLLSKLSLATTYWGLGKKEASGKLGLEVFEVSKEKLGADHPFTLSSMANMAFMYYEQEKFEEAEELGVEVLKLRKEKLGSNNPDTLLAMHNLAITLKKQAREAEAVDLLKDCVARRQQVLGVDHPHTQKSSAALARWEAKLATSAN